MPVKTHKTAVVLIPPREVWAPIQAIRQVHDAHFRRWMPHITLLYPFRPWEEFAELAVRFREALRTVTPFEVVLANFRYFPHRGNRFTLWLEPQPREPLVKLQTALWQVVPDCDDTRRFRNGFTPHLSVGQVRGKRQREKLLEALQRDWQPLRFIVREVALIWRNDPPDDVFRAVEVIPFA